MVESGTKTVVVDDGTSLWTTVGGHGPPVVLCHGGPGLWDYLEDLADLLAGEHTVIRYDQRGCGRSGGLDGPFTLERAVADLDGVRETLGVERWAVLGHSWGADLALRCAIARPQRTTAVVCVGGVGAGERWRAAHDAEAAARLGEDLPRWRELSRRRRTDAEEEEWCLLQWRPDFTPGPDAAAHARALWATRPPGAVINAAAHRLWTHRAAEPLLTDATSLRAPVAMIHGEADPRPAWASDDLAAALPDVHRTVVAGAGHAPWVERPEEVRSLVLDALSRPPRPCG